MGAAGLEQLRRPRGVPDAPADARCVAEDDLPRNAAEVHEDVTEGLAGAFDILAGKDLGEAAVGEGERQHEVARAGAHAVRVEVGLRLAGRPRQIEVALGIRGHAAPRCPDVASHGADGHIGSAFLDEAVVEALGRVALVAVVPRVVCEPLVT